VWCGVIGDQVTGPYIFPQCFWLRISSGRVTITPGTPCIWQSIANKLYYLNWWYYSVVYKKILFPTDDFCLLYHRKNYNPLLLLCPPLYHLTFYTPTKSNLYFNNSLAAAVHEPALYRLLTFQVPNIMSLFRCLVLLFNYTFWKLSLLLCQG